MKLMLTMIASTLLLSQSVFAGADCTAAPRDEWMSEIDMQKKILNEYGFSIQKFKIDGNCYEIYGKSPEGKIEVYFNPVDGSIVKQKRKH